MQQVYDRLPDDKPITAVCVVEEVSKCPPGFYPVSRTHDFDWDADLWRDVPFFTKKPFRYLCLSKTEGNADYVVSDVKIIGEKELPPEGFSVIPKTYKKDSKAWRKKQMAYSLMRRNNTKRIVTDIILLNKAKNAPDGFLAAGDINGLTLCYKVNYNFQNEQNNGPPSLAYSLTPASLASTAMSPNGSGGGGLKLSNGSYPPLLGKPAPPVPAATRSGPTSPGGGEYVNLVRQPKRPAPPTPTTPAIQPYPQLPNRAQRQESTPGSYATLSTYHGLEGVPFVLNPGIKLTMSTDIMAGIPIIKAKTKEELDREFHYDFRLERQT